MAVTSSRSHVSLCKLQKDDPKSESRSLQGSKSTAVGTLKESKAYDDKSRQANSSRLALDNAKHSHDALQLRSSRAGNRTISSSDESWHAALSTQSPVANEISMRIENSPNPTSPVTYSIPPPDLDLRLKQSYPHPLSLRADAITDHKVWETVRSSKSAPQLLVIPSHSSELVQAQDLFHFIQKPGERSSPKLASPVPKDHCRSLSFDDIQSVSAYSRTKENSRSYSEESMTSDFGKSTRFLNGDFPRQPMDPPLDRVTTPPGLPSFGTHNALLYRLDTAPRRFPQPAMVLAKILHPHGETSEQNSPTLQSSSLLSTTQHNHQNNTSTDVMKHLLAVSGISRMVSPLPQRSSSSRRITLPAGVRRSHSPGALARAEDGTLVRGTFPNRGSGHGLGRRDLEAHPYSTRFASIDEVVRQIEKACDQSTSTNLQEQEAIMVNRCMHQQDRRLHREEPQMRRPMCLQPENSSTESRNITLVPRPISARQSRIGGFPTRQPSISRNVPAHKNFGSRNLSRPAPRLSSAQPPFQGRNGMVALQDWVQEGERIQDWQRTERSRRKRQSWWCRCWRWLFSSFYGRQMEIDNV